MSTDRLRAKGCLPPSRAFGNGANSDATQGGTNTLSAGKKKDLEGDSQKKVVAGKVVYQTKRKEGGMEKAYKAVDGKAVNGGEREDASVENGIEVVVSKAVGQNKGKDLHTGKEKKAVGAESRKEGGEMLAKADKNKQILKRQINEEGDTEDGPAVALNDSEKGKKVSGLWRRAWVIPK